MKIIFLICFLKISIAEAPIRLDYFIVRNIGQGQWTTHVTNELCEHFDFGGEFNKIPILKFNFLNQCYNKINKLNLSHADWDHYSFFEFIYKNTKSICWNTKPIDKMNHHFDTLGIDKIKSCQKKDSFINNSEKNKIIFYDNRGKSKNDRSIVQILNSFLVQGDSTNKMEKKWIRNLSDTETQNIKYLILGHHGSHTSTSDQLLKKLSKLKMAVASARFKKYRHPSIETVLKLKRFHIPLLKTEDWGNLIFYN